VVTTDVGNNAGIAAGKRGCVRSPVPRLPRLPDCPIAPTHRSQSLAPYVMQAPTSAERLKRLQSYLEQDPDNLHLLHEAADCALQAGQWQEADVLVERALLLAPQDSLSQYRKAVLLAQGGQAQQSLALTQALLDGGQRHDAVLFQHACNLVLAARHLEAEPILSDMQARAGHFPGFAYFHIRALHAAGKLDEAIAVARAVGEDDVAQGMLSLIHIDAENIDEGRALARQVLARQPDNLDALLADGTASLALEDPRAALPSFEGALERQAENGRAWLGIGLARLSLQDLPGAREALEKTVRLMPSHLGSWNALAWLQLLQNDLDGAEATLESALAIDRNFGETHGTLAVLKAIRQEWDMAKRETDIALRLQPESFAGRFAQSLWLEHRGRPEKAQQLLLHVMQNFKSPAGGNLIDVTRRHLARHPQVARQSSKPPRARK
jgi:tetratricopeptide (TPR) repeat protein